MADTKKKPAKKSVKKPAVSKKPAPVTKKTSKAKKVNASKTKKKQVTKKAPVQQSAWKGSAIVLGIVAIILGISLVVVLVDNTQKTDTLIENSENQEQSTELGVSLLIVEDETCGSCNVDGFANEIKTALFPDLEVRKVSKDSDEGKAILEELNSKFVPVFLFSSQITEKEDWATNFAPLFIKTQIGEKELYALSDQYVPTKVLINEFEIPDSAIIVGDKNAPVTVVEFSDYECPFCAIGEGSPELLAQFRAQTPGYEPPVPAVMEQYVESGDVKFVFMNFPLESLHPRAKEIHQATLCVYHNSDGDTWKAFNEMVFEKRSEWVDAASRKEILSGYATSVGVDTASFETCFDAKEYNSQIEEELALGFSLGISGTPGFIVDKTVLSGAQDFSAFKTIIDAALE